MDLGLKGKTAFVSGGSLGIGRAIAETLAGEGVRVAISARDAPRLQDAADEIIATSGSHALAVPCDMGNGNEVIAAMEKTAKTFGPIDILINNAGDIPTGGIDTLSDEVWQRSFDVKFMGYIRAARAALPGMRQKGWGRIINIIGKAAESPTAGYLAGSAFNVALSNVTKALAQETGPDGVLTIGINPGPTNTNRWQGMVDAYAKAQGSTPEEINETFARRISVRRIGQPADIAGVVAFLCSDHASFINGEVINVDGGTSGS